MKAQQVDVTRALIPEVMFLDKGIFQKVKEGEGGRRKRRRRWRRRRKGKNKTRRLQDM